MVDNEQAHCTFSRYQRGWKKLHLFFLESAPPTPDLAALEAARSASERFVLKEDVFYLYAPDGVGRSKPAAKAEKCLGVAATGRNWRTVEKLWEMAKPS